MEQADVEPGVPDGACAATRRRCCRRCAARFSRLIQSSRSTRSARRGSLQSALFPRRSGSCSSGCSWYRSCSPPSASTVSCPTASPRGPVRSAFVWRSVPTRVGRQARRASGNRGRVARPRARAHPRSVRGPCAVDAAGRRDASRSADARGGLGLIWRRLPWRRVTSCAPCRPRRSVGGAAA